MKRRQILLRQGFRLEILTVAWNCLEGIVAVISGLVAGSVALVSFGLDSAIEVSSGAVLLWRLRADSGDRERVERLALRMVGVSFLLLAAYVLFESAETLWRREAPRYSLVGIALAILSLIVMPLLARAKRRVAQGISSGALHADSRQTDICAYLSAILLGGLLMNAVLGWWWADPAAGLLMVPLIAREGIEALRGKTCCEDVACHEAVDAREEGIQ